jgi:hypothetical protein
MQKAFTRNIDVYVNFLYLIHLIKIIPRTAYFDKFSLWTEHVHELISLDL